MAQQPTQQRWWRRLASILATLVVVVLLAAAVLLVVVPKVLGGMSLTVLTGSMEPTINPGDVVVTKGIDTAQAKDLRVGDIIVFLPFPDDPTLVTHRIVSVGATPKGTVFTTKGDNNSVEDDWEVNDYKVRGKVVYWLPKVGYLRQWAGQSTEWIILGVAVALIGYAIVTFIISFRSPKKNKRAPENDADEDDANKADQDPGGGSGEDRADAARPRRAYVEDDEEPIN
ncbi:MAG: signal peptidase I [Propionibacteriaceae bacterium]|jgi:signal peptidase|nr:signal peptidase I [Propionibacteriaceae bacterium]